MATSIHSLLTFSPIPSPFTLFFIASTTQLVSQVENFHIFITQAHTQLLTLFSTTYSQLSSSLIIIEKPNHHPPPKPNLTSLSHAPLLPSSMPLVPLKLTTPLISTFPYPPSPKHSLSFVPSVSLSTKEELYCSS